MPAAPSMGVLAQLGMSSSSSTANEFYEFINESLALQQEIVSADGIRGSRARTIERLVQGTQSIGGTITLEPTPVELQALLPRILGAAGTGSAGNETYNTAETLPTFWVVIDRVAKVHTYTGCYVDTASFSSSPNGLLRLAMAIEAESESIGNAGTFPTATIDANSPFIHHESTLTLAGSPIQIMDVEVTINNMLKKDRFVNSQTRTNIPAMDRQVSVKCTVPYTADTVALYNVGAGGVTATLKYNYGGAGGGASGKSILFTFGNIVFPARKSPTVPGKDEITLLLEGDARVTAGSPEVIVAIDSVA